MNVISVEDGLTKLGRMLASWKQEGQFHRASFLLVDTVKCYAKNVDDLIPEVVDFKLSLTKGAISRFYLQHFCLPVFLRRFSIYLKTLKTLIYRQFVLCSRMCLSLVVPNE